jgi:hypothetical protein
MNLTSIGLAFSTAAIVSVAAGLTSRRCPEPIRDTGFVWSVAIAMSFAVPILLSSGFADLTRAIRPREAVDWLSFLLLGLASLQTLAKSRSRLFWICFGLGAVVCVGIAGRMLYGGIHFRSGSMFWSGLVWSWLWGAMIFLLWGLETQKNPHLSLTEGFAWLVTIGTIAASLAMSGSIVYSVVVCLIVVSVVFGWIGAARLQPFMAVPAAVLIGLGIAYAEMTFTTGALLTSSMLLLSSSRYVAKKSLRTFLVVTAICLSATSVVIVSRQFALDSSSTSSGYDAYR